MGIDAYMCFRTKTKIEHVNRLAATMHVLFPDTLFIYKPAGKPFKHCIYEEPVSYQDSEDFVCPKGSFQYKVDLACRYYGIGYERGPLWDIIGVASALKHFVPDAEIFYGGDSSGVCYELFDMAAQQKLLTHYFNVQHEPYRGAFGNNANVLCPHCERAPASFLWAGAKSAARCSGCNGIAFFKNDVFVKWAENTNFEDDYRKEFEEL